MQYRVVLTVVDDSTPEPILIAHETAAVAILGTYDDLARALSVYDSILAQMSLVRVMARQRRKEGKR